MWHPLPPSQAQSRGHPTRSCTGRQPRGQSLFLSRRWRVSPPRFPEVSSEARLGGSASGPVARHGAAPADGAAAAVEPRAGRRARLAGVGAANALVQGGPDQRGPVLPRTRPGLAAHRRAPLADGTGQGADRGPLALARRSRAAPATGPVPDALRPIRRAPGGAGPVPRGAAPRFLGVRGPACGDLRPDDQSVQPAARARDRPLGPGGAHLDRGAAGPSHA
jgi:hypothetical protein